MFGRVLPCALVLSLSAGLPGPAHAQAAGDGVYTQVQADRGRRIFGAFCATCHGVDLEGAVGPALAGPDFSAKWSSADHSVQGLYDVMRTTMPKPAAGTLAESSYTQILAYLLFRNGLPAGGRELVASNDVLKPIRIPAPAAARAPAPEFIAGEGSMTPSGPGPTQADLTAAAASTDWLYNTHDYAGTRFAPLRQITPANARRLQVLCAYQVGSVETFVTGPLVWQGTMYLTTGRLTIALDATSCRERWRYTWEPRDNMVWANSRGVAIKDGYVVRGTADGYLLTIDAATGKLLWARQIAKPSAGETITMPPLVFEDMVIIGPAGSENNIQGWIGAFRLKDGTQVWRFNTIPRPGEPGAETWQNPPNVPVGGGGVWTAPTLDVARGELHVAVGNPAPDLPAELRPGKNLYTNSLVVLDVRTGALRWYASLVPEDFHDWDLTQATPLIQARVGGRTRNLIVTVGKDGILRGLDRETHEVLYETPVTTQKDVERPLTKDGVHVCPGVLGGVEWSGPAYHPGTNLLFTPAVDWCTTFSLGDTVRFVPGELYLGGQIALDSTRQGWLTAVDASTGKVRWRYRSPLPMVAAVTTTAGGLVLTGENTGDFLALDATTGRELYRFNTGGGMGGGVISYGVNGRQYIAAASGRSGFWFGSTGAPMVFVFGLPSGALR
jgi:alcohol dehydrogenase (cytochrome c)